MSAPLGEEQVAAIVEAYKRGDKIKSIVETFGVPRSTVYWILEREGVSTNRRTDTFMGRDDKTIAALYALLRRQQEYIARLEAELDEARKGVDTSQNRDRYTGDRREPH
jgi:glutaredoxin 2